MSKYIEFEGNLIATDEEGYLQDITIWSPKLGDHIAYIEGIKLNQQHWLVINFVREFYQEFNTTPAIRMLVKNLEQKFGKEIGNSRYLQKMFNDSPAKTIAKIAGLPKPAKCL